MATYFMEKSYVVAAILCIKNRKLKKEFVTIEEVNTISNLLQTKYNNKNLDVCITDTIDDEYFEVINDIIVINNKNGFTQQSIEQRYQGYITNIDILLTLWDEEFITESLKSITTN